MKTKIFIPLFLAGAFLLGACSDWLQVSSDSETEAGEQFSNEAGFRDAVMGIYIGLADRALYGEDMSYRALEFLAQQYAVVNNATDRPLFTYSYNSRIGEDHGKKIWQGHYKVIANINNVLRWADRNSTVMHPVMDSIVRGELHALRAYCHLDVLRLFGKGDYSNRPELANELAIPYSFDFNYLPPKQETYAKTFELLFADIETALRYLKADPIRSQANRSADYYDAVSNTANLFFVNTDNWQRRSRMNYYACLGLYARALMWEGSAASRAKALEIVEQVLNIGDLTADTDWYQWTTATQMANSDYMQRNGAFIYEQLFSLYVDKFLDYQTSPPLRTSKNNWFDASDPNTMFDVIYLTRDRADYVFEINNGIITDWRYTHGLQAEGGSMNNFAIVKFREKDPADGREKLATYRKRVPMIRITELFYIAAECLADSNPAQAIELLNTVRNKRNIPTDQNLQGLTPGEIREEIRKEYMKEFIAEGQLFFYYKRTGAESIYGYANPMTDAQYVFPLPADEVINGGRQQTEIN